jgi:hypothetical protein
MAACCVKYVPVVSSWVRMFILTSDCKLAVWFKDGVCCYYPSSSRALFDLALTWASPGRFVHHFLYKKLAYKRIKPPCPAPPCGESVACCPGVTVPDTLHATFSNACPCLNGQTVVLNYGSGSWGGNYQGACTNPVTLSLACVNLPPQTWRLTTGCPAAGTAKTASPTSATCSPLNLVFPAVSVAAACCNGAPLQAACTITA